ncbi:bacteriohemerythrin [Pseudodesulfovibrio sp.]|uniref:bacteriohemerythrin n=1 Tax=unclassified Pseudodesulfovibrio TaxID=2661612 RepID=UPI003B006CC7
MALNLNLAGFTKEYIIDIPELDEQHETFFSMLDRIAEIAPDLYRPLEEEEVDELVDVVAELREYALHHFGTEEAYMKEARYPDFAEQKKAHNKFITDVIRMEGDLLNGLVIPPIKVRNFMHDWYRDHILSMDKKFGEFYQSSKT